ncbi:hypothetical protein Tco_1301637 [Tanacetum coccineum]
MLNKDNYVPWSSHLLCYAKSKPNGKMIVNSIINGPYVRRMIVEPSDIYCETPVVEAFHEQTDEQLTKKVAKQMEADDQAIQIILMGLLEDVYAAAEVNEIRAERLAKTHDPLAFIANTQTPYTYLVFHPDQPSQITYMQHPPSNNKNYVLQPSFNMNCMQQPMPNPDEITNPTTAINMALNAENQIRYNVGQIARNHNGYNAVQNTGNQVVQNEVQNSDGNGNVVAAWTGGNGNPIRFYNCRGVGHYVRNYTVRPRRRDVAYLQT